MTHNLTWLKICLAGTGCLLAASLTGPAVTQIPAAEVQLSVAPADEKVGVLGFVVTEFTPVMNDQPNCPAGLNKNMSTLLLEAATPAERARLSSDGGKRDLRMLAFRTPDGKGSLCVHPDAVTIPIPPLNVVEGNGRVRGLDLDGFPTLARPRGKSCGHANFVDAQGRQTIDNQFYRLNGCIQGKRKGGNAEQSNMSELINGSYAIAIELVGVDNRKNDPDVTVNIYSSRDPTPFTATGKPLPNGSMNVHPNPRYHTSAHARLVNGVLRSDPFDLVLDFPVAGAKLEYDMREARIELTLKDDGTAEGLLAGYYPLNSYYKNQVTIGDHVFFGVGAADTIGFTCSAMHRALRQYADGLRDPKTGECGGISFAQTIKAMPTFVLKPQVVAASASTPRK